MGALYEPKDHIHHVEVAPRAESVLDQREITVQTYETTVPFDYDTLEAGLAGAWLTPSIRLGVFARNPGVGKDEIHVVLGLQGELSVRAYDYDERRPLWFSWRDVIVETVAIRYVRGDDGCVRFTTAGGGLRIGNEKLEEFNEAFLKIPKAAVRKLQFDLAKLRNLCFGRFADRLYMLRFSNPSAMGYRSIDHAEFKSRRYIDPAVDRLTEVRADPEVKIESFDSDVNVHTDDLALPAEVRFAIRGLSGALWLRFPKVTYKAQLKTGEEQTRVFYRLVDETVRSILDADYYARRQLSLADLEKNPEFPEFADTTPYREALRNVSMLAEFFAGLDLGEPKPRWLPHLRAVDELLEGDALGPPVSAAVAALVARDPAGADRLLGICLEDARLRRLGSIVIVGLRAELHALPADVRAHVEELLLAWAIEHESDGWDVDIDSGEICAGNLRWKTEDLSLDALAAVLWKLMGVLHARLRPATGNLIADLAKYQWCTTMARGLPPNQPAAHAAVRLLASNRVPRAPADGRRILKAPVATFAALDDEVLDQFGLPLWPSFRAEHRDGVIRLENDGIGSARMLTIAPGGAKPGRESVARPHPVDLPSGATLDLGAAGPGPMVVEFEKYGSMRRAVVPLAAAAAGSAVAGGSILRLRPILSRRRLEAQRKFRGQIDPGGRIAGGSPALLRVFEDIQHANSIDGGVPVLLLGEPGVGKTRIAKLLHDSSPRSSKHYKEVNAGGSGGDLNIQRGEWIGYGKGHGIAGVDPKGKAGHLVEVDGGTIFIDEFAAFSAELQLVFLSVLEKRGIQKVGGETVKPDVRCVFATNADVDEAIESGRLRRDLLDRIGVRVPIPPLRERRGDVIALAKNFVADDGSFDDRCLLALLRHDWPGNVRELQNTVKVTMARKSSDGAATIKLEHVDLPEQVVAGVRPLGDDDARRELWITADRLAREEGFEPGEGLQRRAGEIVGVQEAQASKMYAAFGLSQTS